MPESSLSAELLDRREALLRMSALFGAPLVGSSALISGCATSDSRLPNELFTGADVALLDEIADTILPETASSRGAKAAQTGAFMIVMVADTYTAEEQQIFLAGLESVDRQCRDEYGRGFLAANPSQRTDLLERLDREQFDYMRERQDGMPVHYFRMLKELSLMGFFTSEIGYTEAMRYLETPGQFEPCVPYSPGDRAWAPHA